MCNNQKILNFIKISSFRKGYFKLVFFFNLKKLLYKTEKTLIKKNKSIKKINLCLPVY